jgi:hypothetical protein
LAGVVASDRFTAADTPEATALAGVVASDRFTAADTPEATALAGVQGILSATPAVTPSATAFPGVQGIVVVPPRLAVTPAATALPGVQGILNATPAVTPAAIASPGVQGIAVSLLVALVCTHPSIPTLEDALESSPCIQPPSVTREKLATAYYQRIWGLTYTVELAFPTTNLPIISPFSAGVRDVPESALPDQAVAFSPVHEPSPAPAA